MNQQNLTQNLQSISERMNNIEFIVQRNAEMLKKSLDIFAEQSLLLNHGIKGYIDKLGLRNTEKSDNLERLRALVRADKSLRYPHRKIMNYLIEQYDYEKGVFREIHFSKIVKECRIGKNMAKGYLDILTEKGFLIFRADGYRKFFSVAYSP